MSDTPQIRDTTGTHMPHATWRVHYHFYLRDIMDALEPCLNWDTDGNITGVHNIKSLFRGNDIPKIKGISE